LNSAICQHLQTTLEDLSVLLHHCHWLTNRTVRAYDSNPVWHMARYKCCLLTYLLTCSLSLAIPPRVGVLSIGDGYSHR